MVDKIVVTVTDLAKKHPDKPAYQGFYSLAKYIYQDDGEMVTESFALDKETLEISRAKIMAILIDEMPVKEKKPNSSSTTNESKQTRLS
jgi:hypothetical protein